MLGDGRSSRPPALASTTCTQPPSWAPWTSPCLDLELAEMLKGHRFSQSESSERCSRKKADRHPQFYKGTALCLCIESVLFWSFVKRAEDGCQPDIQLLRGGSIFFQVSQHSDLPSLKSTPPTSPPTGITNLCHTFHIVILNCKNLSPFYLFELANVFMEMG